MSRLNARHTVFFKLWNVGIVDEIQLIEPSLDKVFGYI